MMNTILQMLASDVPHQKLALKTIVASDLHLADVLRQHTMAKGKVMLYVNDYHKLWCHFSESGTLVAALKKHTLSPYITRAIANSVFYNARGAKHFVYRYSLPTTWLDTFVDGFTLTEALEVIYSDETERS